jgi:hypothetical protein
MDERLRKDFLGGAPKQEGKVVGAFCQQNKENALKTKPKVSTLYSPIPYQRHPLSSPSIDDGWMLACEANCDVL